MNAFELLALSLHKQLLSLWFIHNIQFQMHTLFWIICKLFCSSFGDQTQKSELLMFSFYVYSLTMGLFYSALKCRWSRISFTHDNSVKKVNQNTVKLLFYLCFYNMPSTQHLVRLQLWMTWTTVVLFGPTFITHPRFSLYRWWCVASLNTARWEILG